jgi:hypothetical protein
MAALRVSGVMFERLIETQGIGENDGQCGKAD